MNDIELDALLTRHGENWRAANSAPPSVDWDGLVAQARRRTWVVGAGVAATVAATVVAIIATAGSDPGTPTVAAGRSMSPVPPDPADVQYGGPLRYFGIMRGGVYNRTVSSYGLIRSHPFVTAIGGTRSGTTVYSSRPAPACRSRLDVTSYTTNDLLHGRGIAIDGQAQLVATIAGAPTSTPIAVSVPSGELAMIVTSAGTGSHDRPKPLCTGGQQLVFVALRNGAVVDRERITNQQLQIDSLAWSDDGQRLAYRLTPTTAETSELTRATIADSGTHVLDIHSPQHRLENNPRILPLSAAPGSIRYGPVFWWRGAFVVTFNGSLYRVDERGRLGDVVATDFPDRVDSVSSDLSDDHLLIGSGELSYRWDFGQLAPLPGQLAEPSW